MSKMTAQQIKERLGLDAERQQAPIEDRPGSAIAQRVESRQRAKPQRAPTRPTEHELPPHSVEAEKGVLSSMMQLRDGSEAIAECVEKGIGAQHFYNPVHRTIYTMLRDMHDAGKAIDLITVTAELRDRKLLESVGGSPYVTELCTVVPTAANVAYYIDEVRDKYMLREIARAAQIAIERTREAQSEPSAVSDELRSRIDSLHERDDLPEAVPLIALAEKEPDPSKTLLGNRWLCRGSIGLFIGPSGIGKSTASVQQDILWALGRPAFGIKPARPLRILCIQAENDEGDLSEMARGVCNHLALSDEDREVIRQNVIYVHDCSHTGDSFLRMAAQQLKKFAPIDILRIDPLQAYAGGDLKDPAVTIPFLRTGLNPILNKLDCAAMLNCHTPKTTYVDTSHWKTSDWLYSFAGNADIGNTARAALVIFTTHAPDVFEFRAAKRASRIGWCDEDGNPAYMRLFSWEKGGAISWHEATDEDAARVESSKPKDKGGGGRRIKPAGTKDDFFALTPLQGSIEKNALLSKGQDHDIGLNRGRGFWLS